MLMKTQLKKTWYLGIQCPGKHRNFPKSQNQNMKEDMKPQYRYQCVSYLGSSRASACTCVTLHSAPHWHQWKLLAHFLFPTNWCTSNHFFCELRLLAKFPNYRKTLLVVAIMFCLQHQRAAHASKRIWNMELILTKAFAKCITYQQMAQQTTHQMAHQHHIKMDNPDMIAVALNRQWFMVIISYNKVKKSKCFSVHLEISII